MAAGGSNPLSPAFLLPRSIKQVRSEVEDNVRNPRRDIEGAHQGHEQDVKLREGLVCSVIVLRNEQPCVELVARAKSTRNALVETACKPAQRLGASAITRRSPPPP